MNVATLRTVDRWGGTFLTFVLTVVRTLRSWMTKHPPSPGRTIRNLLFVKLAEQGYTVLACGAIQRAIRMVGRENVYFLVFEENRVLSSSVRGAIFFTRAGEAS